MIIKHIDFSQLLESLHSCFSTNLDNGRLGKIDGSLMENIRLLCDANLKCYQANMKVIAERKKDKVDIQLISDMELQARTVGEARVRAKAAINSLLNAAYPLSRGKQKVASENWMSDDIVYSVGEMIDRLAIEKIKVEDYSARLSQATADEVAEWDKKIRLSQAWSERVKHYLDQKLRDIERKGFYECVEETRTYDMRGIDDRSRG